MSSRGRMIIALVPAHNEEESLAAALRSLLNQTLQPDEIIVVLDNCTDRTPAIAADFAPVVRAYVTVDNRLRKAGALNQAIEERIVGLGDDDAIIVMDADCEIVPTFIEKAEAAMAEDVGAVGGIFMAKDGAGMLATLQSSEYARYAREIARGKARAKVISGTAALFKVKALREVARARSTGRLPGGRDQVYDTAALTEDNELTLALKHLGYRCVSPKGCKVHTEVMLTLPKLYHQRLRWQRGAIDNLRSYGLTRVTRPYIARQVLMGLGVPINIAFWFIVVYSLLLLGGLSTRPLWLGLTALFVFERVWTVRKVGRSSMLTAMAIVPEMFYDTFQQFIFVAAGLKSLRHSNQEWVAT